MFDIREIRDDPEAFDAGLAKRGLAPQSPRLLPLDEARRRHVAAHQAAQERRNALSKEIGQAKAAKDEARAATLMAEVAQLKTFLQDGEEEGRRLDTALEAALSEIPNLPADDVPVGPDEHANVERHRHGAPQVFPFSARQHFELGEASGLMDFETAAKLSGARFVVLKGAMARLERALAQFMLDTHTAEFGYTEVSPPLLVRDEAMFGTAQLPKFFPDQFAAFPASVLEHDEADGAGYAFSRKLGDPARYWLIPTAEVPLTNLVRDSILTEDELPLRLTAWTPCFRAEAGAAGRDTRGMIRQHQFSKVELVSVTTPDTSAEEHERMLSCAEEILKRLGLAYRVMLLSSGDMGFAARKTYDIEVWLPGQDAYREISSCSVCGDFQARRMAARYRPREGKGPRHVHTLNGSALAVGRTMVAILETYQDEGGGVSIPDALAPYMGGVTRIDPRVR